MTGHALVMLGQKILKNGIFVHPSDGIQSLPTSFWKWYFYRKNFHFLTGAFVCSSILGALAQNWRQNTFRMIATHKTNVGGDFKRLFDILKKVWKINFCSASELNFFFFVKKWCFFASLSFFEMKFCLRAILGIWLKIEDKILLDDCNHSPNLVTSSACFFWKMFEKSIFVLHLNSNCFCFFKKWYFFGDLSFFEMKFCLRAILGIWLKVEDKILLDNCNHSPNLVTSSACYF